MPVKRWITAKEIAHATGKSVRWIQMQSKKLKWKSRSKRVRGGRVLLFDREEVFGGSSDSSSDDRTKPAEVSHRSFCEFTLDRLPETARVVVQQRMQALEARDTYRASADEIATAEADAEFVEIWNATAHEHGGVRTSVRNLRRWATALRAKGPAGLSDGRQVAGVTATRAKMIPPEFWQAFKRFWLSQNRPHVTQAYDIALGYASKDSEQRKQWRDEYSVKLFYRRIKELPQQLVVCAREGWKAWADKCETPILRDYGSLQSGEVYTSDHRTVDFDCWDPKTRKVVRLYCTAWQDVRSRMILSWRMEITPPNQERVMLTFAQAVTEWGLPKHIHIDNGRDYSCKKFAGTSRRWRVNLDEDEVVPMLSELEVSCHFATPYQGRAKVIERHFNFFSQRFDKLLVSYCGNRPDANLRPERCKRLRKDSPEQLPRVEDIRIAFGQFIEWFNTEFRMNGDSMNNRTPLEVWHAHNHTMRIHPKMSELKLLLMPSEMVTVRRGMASVTIAGQSLNYMDDFGYLANVRANTRVRLRYDPESLGTAFLFDESNKFICEVQESRRLPWDFNSDDVRESNKKQAARKRALRKAVAAETDLREHPDALAAVVQQRQGYGAQSEGIIESTGTDGPLERDRDVARTFDNNEPSGFKLYGPESDEVVDESLVSSSDSTLSDSTQPGPEPEDEEELDWMAAIDRLTSDDDEVIEEEDWQAPFRRAEELEE